MTKNPKIELWIDQGTKLYKKVKSATSAAVVFLQGLDSKMQKKVFLSGVALAILNLAYSLFSLYTLLSFGLMLAFLAGYAFISIKQLKKKGLITCLSSKTQKLLLERSLFDLLCDLLVLPKNIYIYQGSYHSVHLQN